MEWIDEALSEGVVPDDIPAEVAPASDVEEVNRLMRRLRHVQRQIGDVNDQHAAEVRALARWRSQQLARLEAVRDFIERALEGWARNEFRVSGTKTQRMPYGTLSLRQKRSSVDVYDEEAAILALRAAGLDGLIREKEEVNKGAVQDAVSVGVSPVLALGRGEAGAPVEGLQPVPLRIERLDPETGELTTELLPGVRLSQPVQGVDGLGFSIGLRDEQGEET